MGPFIELHGGPADAGRALPGFCYALIPYEDAVRPSDPCRLRAAGAARFACPLHVAAMQPRAARPARTCQEPGQTPGKPGSWLPEAVPMCALPACRSVLNACRALKRRCVSQGKRNSRVGAARLKSSPVRCSPSAALRVRLPVSPLIFANLPCDPLRHGHCKQDGSTNRREHYAHIETTGSQQKNQERDAAIQIIYTPDTYEGERCGGLKSCGNTRCITW